MSGAFGETMVPFWGDELEGVVLVGVANGNWLTGGEALSVLGVGGDLATVEFVLGDDNGGELDWEGVEGGGEETEGESGAFVLGGGGDKDGGDGSGGDDWAGVAGTGTGGDLVVGWEGGGEERRRGGGGERTVDEGGGVVVNGGEGVVGCGGGADTVGTVGTGGGGDSVMVGGGDDNGGVGGGEEIGGGERMGEERGGDAEAGGGAGRSGVALGWEMGGCGGGEERETGGGAKAFEPVGDTTAESLAGEEGEGAEAISFNSFLWIWLLGSFGIKKFGGNGEARSHYKRKLSLFLKVSVVIMAWKAYFLPKIA
jgi:hypothetical protein